MPPETSKLPGILITYNTPVFILVSVELIVLLRYIWSFLFLFLTLHADKNMLYVTSRDETRCLNGFNNFTGRLHKLWKCHKSFIFGQIYYCRWRPKLVQRYILKKRKKKQFLVISWLLLSRHMAVLTDTVVGQGMIIRIINIWWKEF